MLTPLLELCTTCMCAILSTFRSYMLPSSSWSKWIGRASVRVYIFTHPVHLYHIYAGRWYFRNVGSTVYTHTVQRSIIKVRAINNEPLWQHKIRKAFNSVSETNSAVRSKAQSCPHLWARVKQFMRRARGGGGPRHCDTGWRLRTDMEILLTDGSEAAWNVTPTSIFFFVLKSIQQICWVWPNSGTHMAHRNWFCNWGQRRIVCVSASSRRELCIE
jgi:hypothetical protein